MHITYLENCSLNTEKAVVRLAQKVKQHQNFKQHTQNNCRLKLFLILFAFLSYIILFFRRKNYNFYSLLLLKNSRDTLSTNRGHLRLKVYRCLPVLLKFFLGKCRMLFL